MITSFKKKQPVFSYLFLILSAFGLNLFFFFLLANDNFCKGMIGVHGEIAYNVWRRDAFLINKERNQYRSSLEGKNNRRIHYYEIDHSLISSASTTFKSTIDTPFYGLLLGLLWKITHSLSYNDIIIVQMLLFTLCICLLYRIASIIFSDKKTAFCIALAHLAFFPLTYLNVYPLRDIWVYYGLMIMFYGIVTYFYNAHSWKILLSCALFFSLCQLIRPPLFASFLALIFVICIGMVFKFIPFFKGSTLIVIMTAANICGFWVPFSSYNKKIHDRIMVSSHGQTCLSGLGELPNRWGYKVDDGWFDYYMKKNFNLQVDTPECNEKALQIFFKTIIEDPGFYLKILLYRLPNLLLPGLVWFSYVPNFDYASLKQKIVSAFFSFHALSDLVGRQLYIRLYLFCGYLGIIFLFLRRYYFLVLLLFFGIIASSWWMVFVHLEHRYLIPYYAFFSVPIGYLFSQLFYRSNSLLFKYSFFKRVCNENS